MPSIARALRFPRNGFFLYGEEGATATIRNLRTDVNNIGTNSGVNIERSNISLHNLTMSVSGDEGRVVYVETTGSAGVLSKLDINAVGFHSEGIHPGHPRLDVGVAVANLGAGGRPVAVAVEAAVEIDRVEQRDADAGIGGRRQQRIAHRVGVVVRRAVGLVVDIVELADRGLTGHRHLREHGAGQAVVAVGVEAGGRRVHDLSPGPERSGTGLGP